MYYVSDFRISIVIYLEYNNFKEFKLVQSIYFNNNEKFFFFFFYQFQPIYRYYKYLDFYVIKVIILGFKT